MSAFKLSEVSSKFEDVAHAALSSPKPRPNDRDTLRTFVSDIRQFLCACEASREEIEAIVAWKNRRNSNV